MEQWKTHPTFTKYDCSNQGRIKNNQTNKILKCHKLENGYIRTIIRTNNNKSVNPYVHRLIAQTWIPNPDNKPSVNHINKIKDDNRIENLEWSTDTEQQQHKIKFNKENGIQNNIPRRGVWKCDLKTKERITFYNSILEATKDLGIKGTGSLHYCLSGKRLSSYGFYWEYDQQKDSQVAQTQKGEKWKIYKKINSNIYYISNFGNVKNKDKLVKGSFGDKGYMTVCINKHKVFVHRMVALKFIPNPNKFKMVNHKDGNKVNNHVDNLEWATNSMNVKHAIETGLRKGINKIVQYDDNDNIVEIFKSAIEAGQKLKLHPNTIHGYCKGKNVSPQFKLKYLADTDDITNKKIDSITIPQNKQDIKNKKVIQYDENGNIIKVFDTIMECAKAFNIQRHTVRLYCNGTDKKKRHKINLKWLSDSDDLINMKVNLDQKTNKKTKRNSDDFHTNREISIYHKKDNNFIETLKNPKLASQKYNLSARSIVKHCKGEIAYSKSPYVFKFAVPT